jgi:pimeloyl-ACP methyl ester carboxylesterase
MKDKDVRRFAASGLSFPLRPTREGYFTSDDARLWFETFGTGVPVLLLHGGMGNGTNWAGQIRPLVRAGYRPIVLDTRGHGRSGSGSKRFSYKLFADDTTRLMGHLELPQALVVGWSDGACTALEMARTNPDRVVGVVFFACNVDPTGTREFVMSPAIGNCVTRHKLDFERMTPTLEQFEELQPKLEPMQKNEPNYSLETLRTITVPVAVVQGDQDEFIKPSHAEYLAASLPNSHFELVKGEGHFAPIQNPNLFNRVMLRHLRWLRSRATP